MLRTPGPPTGLPVDRLNLRGGRLCLDFVNTVDPRWGDDNLDYLDSYPALIAWGVHAGALTLDQMEALRQQGEARPAEAVAALAAAIELREALFHVFTAAEQDEDLSPADLAVVNAAVGSALGHARLVRDGDCFAWGWDEDGRALDRVLWPVVRSATELLTSAELRRVHACPAGDCGWLFLDETKNSSRRWCSMEVCGSREKARAYYRRRRAAHA